MNARIGAGTAAPPERGRLIDRRAAGRGGLRRYRQGWGFPALNVVSAALLFGPLAAAWLGPARPSLPRYHDAAPSSLRNTAARALRSSRRQALGTPSALPTSIVGSAPARAGGRNRKLLK